MVSSRHILSELFYSSEVLLTRTIFLISTNCAPPSVPLPGALLQRGGPLSPRPGLVPSTDALHSPRSADGGEDPWLLRSPSGSSTCLGHEPRCALVTHRQGPSRKAGLRLHPGPPQSLDPQQALPAPRRAPDPQGPH